MGKRAMVDIKCGCSGEEILILVLCFLLPPVGVYMRGHRFDVNFWLVSSD